MPRLWQRDGWASRLLAPLAVVHAGVVAARRRAYRAGWLRSVRSAVPVVVVGNITVGGTGKTPLVTWLVELLRDAGWSPGVVARGYGGRAGDGPLAVTEATDPAQAGDEPVLLARRLPGLPVVVGRDRPAAVRAAYEDHGCDIVLSDDGLQHYRMVRDAEIVVVDGERWLGNGRLLPAGPLREPPSRLLEADIVAVHGTSVPGCHGSFRLRPGTPRPVDGRERAWPGGAVHAVAGTGHPDRFFATLAESGIAVRSCHRLPDHHAFRASDLELEGEAPIIMTEKDAVKCQRLPGAERAWYLPVSIDPDAGLVASVRELIGRLAGGGAA